MDKMRDKTPGFLRLSRNNTMARGQSISIRTGTKLQEAKINVFLMTYTKVTKFYLLITPGHSNTTRAGQVLCRLNILCEVKRTKLRPTRIHILQCVFHKHEYATWEREWQCVILLYFSEFCKVTKYFIFSNFRTLDPDSSRSSSRHLKKEYLA